MESRGGLDDLGSGLLAADGWDTGCTGVSHLRQVHQVHQQHRRPGHEGLEVLAKFS